MKRNFMTFIQKSKYKIVFLVSGTASLIWFIVRVVPKPSRATYPCMRAAAPLASSLVMYLLGLFSFTMLMRKAGEKIKQSKYIVAASLGVLGVAIGIVSQVSYNNKLNAQPLVKSVVANAPLGEGVGIFPGRVVWQYNPDVTNQDCTNENNDYWYQEENTNGAIVLEMLSSGLQQLTGESSDEKAWEMLFKYYNNKTGRGNTGYKSGEKIAIKTNMNGIGNSWTSSPPKNINTSPQVTYAILDQLVHKAGVAQEDISIGDPNCAINDVTYDYCAADFPDVHYWGNGTGKERAVQSSSKVFYASDGSTNDYLPKAYVEASYLINIPVFKKHHRAGISIAAKNHFGSIAAFTGGAWHLHPSLPCPEATSVAENGDHGVYRCFVDIMGHEDLGGKTILYLVDGLWGSTNWGHPPVKFRMDPFNNDWPSSLFLSQDPVAVEAVCFDFLFEEFDDTHPTEGVFVGEDKGPYPQFPGTTDYLEQAADPSLRPSGIVYDPEDDGSELGSLGAFEHWNNAQDKQYSRNLGLSKGIELVGDFVTSSTVLPSVKKGLTKIYPNPFQAGVNIAFELEDTEATQLVIYNARGSMVFIRNIGHVNGKYEFFWDGRSTGGSELPAGNYILNVIANRGSEKVIVADKLVKTN